MKELKTERLKDLGSSQGSRLRFGSVRSVDAERT